MAPSVQEGVRPEGHAVLFYDDESGLVDPVVEFLAAGLAAGDVVVVIATQAHNEAFRHGLAAKGIDPAAALEGGHLRVFDAAETMSRFVGAAGPDREAFNATVGTVIRDVAASGRRLRAYGEMVALLWDAGDVVGAIDLEVLWNELLNEVPFSLFCAYHARSVMREDRAEALRSVCDLHSEIVGHRPSSAGPADPVRRSRGSGFAPDVQAASAARYFVVDVLRRWGHGILVDDAALVVTELAANAIVHAGSPFRVEVDEHPNAIRISVRDGSTEPPAFGSPGDVDDVSGRGIRLVRQLARCGYDIEPAGKVVWAELPLPRAPVEARVLYSARIYSDSDH